MSENFYLKKTFNDFDDMVKALHYWRIEIRQLEKVKIDDTLEQLAINNIRLLNAKITGKTHHVGEGPPGRTFAFLRGESSRLLFRKKDIPLNGLMIFPFDSQVDGVTKGIKNILQSISVPEEVLIARLTPEEKLTYTQIVSTQDVLIIPKPEMDDLQNTFDRYFQSVDTDPGLIHMRNFQICLEEEILSVLISALFSRQSSDDEYTLLQKDIIWEKLESYIEANKTRPIKISELSKSVVLNERTLYRIFHKRFGITPKTYLNRLRLNGVRADLKGSSTRKVKITDIANRWGYWHMGQFASDFKQLFGELPSETLESSFIQATLQ